MAGNVRQLNEMWNTSPIDPLARACTEDDAALIEAARCDSAAFAQLYRRYVTPIYRYLFSRTGNEADAQDLTAQVFLEALEGLRRYRDRGKFTAWLFTIARRRAIDHYHRRPVLTLDEESNAIDNRDPLSDVIQDESLEHLSVLVAQLDDDQRELLRLRFAAGLTLNQIGLIQGRSEAAVKMALHRLLEHLRARWGSDEHVES